MNGPGGKAEKMRMKMRLREFHPVVRLALLCEAERRGLSVFEFLAMLESESMR